MFPLLVESLSHTTQSTMSITSFKVPRYRFENNGFSKIFFRKQQTASSVHHNTSLLFTRSITTIVCSVKSYRESIYIIGDERKLRRLYGNSGKRTNWRKHWANYNRYEEEELTAIISLLSSHAGSRKYEARNRFAIERK